ncbi:MAG TPA: AMP-binding protein [Acidimicrobiia bacterium]|nr:AMP-binding protein [Acidimicrobiia bacterium]
MSGRREGGGGAAPLAGVVLSRIVAAEAARDPGRAVFVFENRDRPAERVTAAGLAAGGVAVADALRRLGLRTGMRVAVLLRNHPALLHALVAGAKLGLPVVPLDPAAGDLTVETRLRALRCAALVTADYRLADGDLAGVLRRTGVKGIVVSTPEGRAAGLDWSATHTVLDESPDGAAGRDPGEHVDDPAWPWLVVPGSGANGDTVGLEVPHERLLLWRLVPGFFGYRPDDVAYTALPLADGNALAATVVPALLGAVHHAVVSRQPDPARLWEICIDHGCTTWANGDGLATAVYRAPSSRRDRTHPVRLVVSTGMPREIWRPFEERFAVRVLEWYGSPEGAFAYNPVGVGPVGSFGRPPAGLLEMEVLDGDGEALPAGRVGELAVRRRDGWVRTGHRVSRDANGWLAFALGPARGMGGVPPTMAAEDAEEPVLEPVTPTRDGSEEETYRRSAASIGGGEGR